MANRNRKYPELYDPKQLQQLVDECGSAKAVARKLGCDAKTVWQACKKQGIELRPRPLYPQIHNPDKLRALQAELITDRAIARKIGCTDGMPANH